MSVTTEPTIRSVVSGGSGFVGQHLVERLHAIGSKVWAPNRDDVDVCNLSAVRNLVREAAPSAFFHLAAFSSPLLSWDRPNQATLNNVTMTANVLEAMREESPNGTVVLVGSGQVYGEPSSLPATEDTPFGPPNPYALSKAMCDMMGGQYAEGFGMRVLRMRPFNHSGPGQSDKYVIGSITRQIAEAEQLGLQEITLKTGNSEVARDFCDVRDVTRAYIIAAGLESGAYNVCSGRSTTVAELVALVRRATAVEIRHEVDMRRVRMREASIVYGSHEKLTSVGRWEPEIDLEQTVRDTLDSWRRKLDS